MPAVDEIGYRSGGMGRSLLRGDEPAGESSLSGARSLRDRDGSTPTTSTVKTNGPVQFAAKRNPHRSGIARRIGLRTGGRSVTVPQAMISEQTMSRLKPVSDAVHQTITGKPSGPDPRPSAGGLEVLEDRTVPAGCMPNDPEFPQQWPLHNTGQTGGLYDADIDMPAAWSDHHGEHDHGRRRPGRRRRLHASRTCT